MITQTDSDSSTTTLFGQSNRHLADPEPWVVVPTGGGRDHYISALCEIAPYRTVIVHTTATEEDVLTPRYNAHQIRRPGEINISRWWNEGLNYAASSRARYVCVVNDDVTLPKEGLLAMQRALQETDGTLCMAFPHANMITGWCWLLDLAHGIRPDERYRWFWGDVDIAERAGAGVRYAYTGAIHHHPNVLTEQDPALKALAALDTERWERLHA